MKILGISAYYHDSAAALIADNHIIAAAQEERFSRIKHDASFPENAIKYCLKEANITVEQLDAIVFYDKPILKFDRLLETYLSYAPFGFKSFVTAMPIWLKEKLFLKQELKTNLSKIGNIKSNKLPKLYFNEHHRSHAASAFFPSPFKKAAVLCLDGVGEWATTSVWLGNNNQLSPLWEIHFPHSLGLLYSAFTYYTGFKVNSGEYKLMGLAPYGAPKYANKIRENLIDIKPDGTFRLNMQYFNFATGLSMTNKKFTKLFGAPPRKPESEITQREMDLAASIQLITEEILLKLAKTIQTEYDVENLCLAGGVALNCVANGKLANTNIFKNIWIQPAAGDAGGALGAALSLYYEHFNQPRIPTENTMQGAYLGPQYSSDNILEFLQQQNIPYQKLNTTQIYSEIAELLKNGAVIGWYQGRMEFGPRALGNRSIIADARNPKMQSTLNLKIKYRESFRPFAPAIKHNKVQDWFQFNQPSPYMLFVAPLKQEKQVAINNTQQSLFGLDKLHLTRSDIPAVTHVDYSARLQTVHPETNPEFYALLSAFEAKTNCPILVNTSFNVRGEPIVCTPQDAYRCFMRTEMDYLVLGEFLLTKNHQPKFEETNHWQTEFTLD